VYTNKKTEKKINAQRYSNKTSKKAIKVTPFDGSESWEGNGWQGKKGR
jgi:hypothetical protein